MMNEELRTETSIESFDQNRYFNQTNRRKRNMPISITEARKLPRIDLAKSKGKGGKKVDWSMVFDKLLSTTKAYTVVEVRAWTNDNAMLVTGMTISRIRVKKKLDAWVTEKKLEIVEDGSTFNYYKPSIVN